jgi:hypothetical protein
MRKSCFAAVFLLAVWLAPNTSRADDDLAQRIESVINGPDYKQARWGILIVEATGEGRRWIR